MTLGVPVQRLAFGPFCLEITTTRLLRDGAPLDLRLQAFHALRVLLQNAGRPVDYEQMIREAWDGVYVSRHTVAVTVGEVKKALRECGSWITCRPGLGYRLDVPESDGLIRKGWHFLGHRTRESLDRAVNCFQQAVQADSGDVRAFEGLSRAYLNLGTNGMRAPQEVYPAFQQAHRQAVALTGMTPELRTDLGYALHMFERKLAEAESELLRARREQPSLAITCVRLTMLYAAMGRLDEALQYLDEAYRADPLLPLLPATETAIRFIRREYDCAIECGKKAVELHPYVQLARVFYAQALEYAGRRDEALAQYRNACVICPDLPWLRALEAACLAGCGRAREATEVLLELQRIRSAEYVDAYYLAILQEALGNRDAALQEMERAYLEGSATLSIVGVDPKMDWLRREPRLQPERELGASPS